MTSRHERLQKIFLTAVELVQSEREKYLDQECGEDAELRADVEEMLEADFNAHTQAGQFLQQSGIDLKRQLESAKKEATSNSREIGPYKILQEIGHGGMGTVFMAEQSKPVRRRVALKLVRAGMDTKQIITRFEAERQALAMMDHVNIAKVLDAGATDDGVPYFVMELVRGISITEYCDQYKLSIEERMKLFMQACRAIQHAHQKGIIHRDIKPSNVLVTQHDGQPIVKVIDFGLAKALQNSQRLTDETMFTEFGQVVGTLQYMSPEQAEMNSLDVDTRSDVFSLGVLLYELLTGSTPIERQTFKQLALDRLMVAIRDEEPPRPSQRLSSIGESATQISQQRKTDVRKLGLILRGDLDWIAMKALEKDRTRRYDSPIQLAEDVQRYLDGEAILARPPSIGYRFTKTVRRHRKAIVAASLLLIALLAGIVTTTWQWRRAEVALDDNSKLIGSLREQKNIAEDETKRSTELAAKNLDLFKVAENQRQLADAAAANEREARKLVEDERERIAELLYSTRISLAWREWLDSNSQRVQQLLVECPKELRGWEWRYLDELTRAEELALYGHTAPKLVRYSPEGNYLISTGVQDGNLKVWDGSTGQELLSEQVGNLISVAPLNNADHALVVADRRVIYLTVKAKRGESYVADQDGVEALAGVLYDDDTKIAGAYADGTLKLFDRTKTTGPRSFFKCPVKLGFASSPPPVFHPEASFIAGVDGSKSKVMIWDVQTGEVHAEIQGHVKDVTTLVFSPDGKYIASGGGGAGVILTDVTTGEPVTTLRAHHGAITSLAFSRDGKWLATGSTDRTCRVFDVETGYEWLVLRGHTQRIQSIDFHPDGDRLVTASTDGSMKVWNIRDRLLFAKSVSEQLKEEKVSHMGHIGGVESQIVYGHLAPQFDVRFSPDGRYIATAALGDSLGDQQIQVWSVPDQKVHASFPVKQGLLNTLTFSADNKYLIVVSGGAGNFERAGSTTVWDLETKEQVHQWDGPPCMLSQPVLNTNGNLLTVCYGNLASGLIQTYSFPEGKLIKEWKVTGERLSSLAYSADDDRLISASHPGGTIRVWDPRTGEQLDEFQAFPTGVFRVAVGSNNLLATANMDGTIGIWDWEKKIQLGELKGHNTYAVSLAFNPDGTRLLSGSEDETLKIWDLKSYSELLSFRDHLQVVYGSDWSPDGNSIASVSADGAMILRSTTPMVPENKEEAKWITLFEDDFEREQLGGNWEASSGYWTIENGKLVGTQQIINFEGGSFPGAYLNLTAKPMPRTVEVSVDVQVRKPMLIQTVLENTANSQSASPFISMNGMPWSFIGSGVLLMRGLNQVQLLGSKANAELEVERTYKMRVLRDGTDLQLFLNGRRQEFVRVPDTELDQFSLAGAWSAKGMFCQIAI